MALGMEGDREENSGSESESLCCWGEQGMVTAGHPWAWEMGWQSSVRAMQGHPHAHVMSWPVTQGGCAHGITLLWDMAGAC